jgi:putative transposase
MCSCIVGYILGLLRNCQLTTFAAAFVTVITDLGNAGGENVQDLKRRTGRPSQGKPRSGERPQPTARAVDKGKQEEESPGGTKENLPHTSSNVLLHFIFSTLGRRPLIKTVFRGDLFAYLGGIVREMRGTALAINGTADHVHLLIRIRPVHSSAEIARVVKTNSSKWAREKWSREFAWQTGYAAFSVSESNVRVVTKYIAGQEEHHKKHSFQEEFVAFLKKNNVEYDERYIWD